MEVIIVHSEVGPHFILKRRITPSSPLSTLAHLIFWTDWPSRAQAHLFTTVLFVTKNIVLHQTWKKRSCSKFFLSAQWQLNWILLHLNSFSCSTSGLVLKKQQPTRMSQKMFEKSLVVIVLVASVGLKPASADFDYCSITKKHTMCLPNVSWNKVPAHPGIFTSLPVK